jgi:DNA-binding response OmpR family regulator
MATILLIEPDRLLGSTYAAALESADHKVVVCPGAQSGVLVADQIKPDLVIIELQLVEHSGIEFLYEFRSYADWQSIPIIIHSQVPQSEFSGSFELLTDQLGVVRYLYKPSTSLKELIQTVNEQLAVPA